MYVIVVGLSSIGQTFAKILVKRGCSTVVIDKDNDRCREFASEVDTLVIHGDAEDKETLLNAGIDRADALVAATNDDSVNLMIAKMARDLNVKNVIAILRDVGHSEVFKSLGIKAVPSDVIAAERIYRSLFNVEDFLSIEGTEVAKEGPRPEVLCVKVEERSSFIGRRTRDIRLPSGFQVIGVLREGKSNPPQAPLKIRAGDKIILYAHNASDYKSIKRVIEEFKGKGK